MYNIIRLMDFKIDASGLRTFEGVDYSEIKEKQKEVLEEVEQYIIQEEINNKRERKNVQYFDGHKDVQPKPKKPKLPKQMNLPRLDPQYFYNRTRLEELHERQKEMYLYKYLRYDKKVEEGEDMSKYDTEPLLPPELEKERLKLLDEGYSKFNRRNYSLFCEAYIFL